MCSNSAFPAVVCPLPRCVPVRFVPLPSCSLPDRQLLPCWLFHSSILSRWSVWEYHWAYHERLLWHVPHRLLLHAGECFHAFSCCVSFLQ